MAKLRSTDELKLDQFNQSLRANPEYRSHLQSLGVNIDQPWGLSDDQRRSAETWVTDKYGDLGKRMEIDKAGNVNQNEGFAKQARRWGPIIGAGIATALTAGAASPLLAAAVGGGVGGATGALDEGGWKGGLTGAAIGASPGVIGHFAKGGTAAAGTASNAATAGGIPGEIALSTAAPTSGAVNSIGSAAASGGGSGMFGGLLGKLGAFGKGLDPTMMLLLGLDAIMGGGGDEGGMRESFREPGALTDPKVALYQALAATNRLGQGLSERGPVRLSRGSVVQRPKPINLPGLPFQIGGGLGMDPALADPSILASQRPDAAQMYDPFQSLDSAGVGEMKKAKQRSPK